MRVDRVFRAFFESPRSQAFGGGNLLRVLSMLQIQFGPAVPVTHGLQKSRNPRSIHVDASFPLQVLAQPSQGPTSKWVTEVARIRRSGFFQLGSISLVGLWWPPRTLARLQGIQSVSPMSSGNRALVRTLQLGTQRMAYGLGWTRNPSGASLGSSLRAQEVEVDPCAEQHLE